MKNSTRLSNKTNNAWSCAEDQILENSNLRNMILNICNERISKTLSVNLFTCKGTFLTDWVGRMIRWKFVVQGLYQLRKGTSAGRAFTYFYTIHRVGRTRMKGSSCLQSNTCSMPGSGWGASQVLNFWSPQGQVSGVWPRIHSDFFRCVFGCQWWTVESASAAWLVPYLLQILAMNENCFCYCSSRNNQVLVGLFVTLTVQFIVLTKK